MARGLRSPDRRATPWTRPRRGSPSRLGLVVTTRFSPTCRRAAGHAVQGHARIDRSSDSSASWSRPMSGGRPGCGTSAAAARAFLARPLSYVRAEAPTMGRGLFPATRNSLVFVPHKP